MKLDTHTKKLKNFWIWRDIRYWSYQISAFSSWNLAFTCFPEITNFSSMFFFVLHLFKLSCAKKHNIYNLYHIPYTLIFCYVMYFSLCVVNMYYWTWTFLRGLFLLLFPNQIIIIKNTVRFLEQKILFNTKIKKKKKTFL